MEKQEIKIKENNFSSITDFQGYDLEAGFAWITLDDGTEEGLPLQACLEQRVDGKKSKKSINKSDDGMLDGICGDANEKAFDKYGYEECRMVFYREMRDMGIKF